MDYRTFGKTIYPHFSLPFVYVEESVAPERGTGFMGFCYVESGTLFVEDESGSRSFLAPLVAFFGTEHKITRIRSTGGKSGSCVFKPEAVNANLADKKNSETEFRAGDYFFFCPFLDVGNSGYVVHSVPSSICASIIRLCDLLNGSLNLKQDESWPCISRSYFLETLILLERNRYLAPMESPCVFPSAASPIAPVLEYLHTSYREDISLDTLASAFATNRTTLNKRFNEACKMSAIAYLNTIRLEVAASFLRNTQLSLAEVADRTGFSDESYFSKLFRKKRGVSPVQYRKSFPDPYHPA